MSPIRAENRARYPADWPAISRHIRFTRAGGRCECAGECGTTHPPLCEARHGQRSPYTAPRDRLRQRRRDIHPLRPGSPPARSARLGPGRQ